MDGSETALELEDEPNTLDPKSSVQTSSRMGWHLGGIARLAAIKVIMLAFGPRFFASVL